MLSTAHLSCNILTDLLIAHGVRHAVISPGSRNTPLIIALSRREEITCHVVIDERSAAFIALGMGVQSGAPIALVCTSGTALLNYAPAVAEAFYRHIPLVVISADRPEEWIDQDDSQTLWQQDALAPYVKRSCDISARIDFPNGPWWTDRMINDTLLEALNGRRAPVHINVRLDAPLNTQTEYHKGSARVIEMVSPRASLPVSDIRAMAMPLASPARLLIIAGFHAPDEKLNRALIRLASLPNVVVMTESISNLHSPSFISRIDSTLCRLSEDEKRAMRPDTVITIGGAIVSRHIKEWLRSLPDLEHWHIGISHTTIDCFKHLTKRVEIDETIFMTQLAAAMQPHRAQCEYACQWHEAALRAKDIHDTYVCNAPWSDLKALSYVFAQIPRRCNLHLSNGTAIRYAQLMECGHVHRSECNRGVSGIDGCTSTALGASALYNGVTVLISGDMSFQYDISALSSRLMTPRFKMIVMCNGGGGIFRFIGATSALPETEQFFAVGTNLPLRQLCDGYGIEYYEATDEASLKSSFGKFITEHERPALLAIHTPPQVSAEVLKGYFEI
ncbi:MAG: 2-succinyl-5-enolpyruvyl-6-hydroxy-3-cyclohexene-1-carboxylic-acid synthase [Duncaniella sp.]|nr:2-succinyl-5-enolpyruvyl-6-hydroxy-3-cyclohexene-1-carboxylic-acid synthase [Duncaniella sp.]